MKIRLSTPYDVASLTVYLAACLYTLAVYTQLPETLATHFDAHGDPNGFMSKLTAALFSPILAAVLWPMTRLVPVLATRVGADAARVSAQRIAPPLACAALVLVMLVHVGLLRYALDPRVPIVRGVYLGVSLLLVVVGLLMPRSTRNAWIGIRNAWTLTSDKVWARVHRFAGQLFVMAGLVCGFSALFLVPSTTSSVVIASVVTTVAASFAYSWWVSRSLST